ncbi:cytochrome P450 [Pleurocapsa sp. FMAR1]|uniref:cytochrome P450 n=1 Tax=Pleurocapsa sp. FMAR1 TaxID=3040204 RepID=UPI0029C7651E|nr:cytochrome P450 [Pleurocapsa sp. FMAR1]
MKQIPTIKSTSGWLRSIRQINAILRPLEFIEKRTQKYGDFYQVTFKNSPPTIMTSNPKAIEEIFTASTGTFEVGRGNKMLSFLVGDNSLLLLDGKEHRNRRRLLMPPFHGESLQKCSEQIVNITNKACDRLETDKPFKVRSLTQEITMRVILSVVFGIDSGERYDRLRELLTTLLETFNTPLNSSLIFFPWLQKDWGKFSPWGRFLLLQQEIRTLIYAEIKERRELLASQNIETKDIFSLLLLAKDENGEGMTDEELHDELITLLFAGHETTASALAWLFYWVHYFPEVQEKLRFELNSLGNNLNYQEINNLAYLNAVVSETLRIYPIAIGTFARLLTKPMSIMEYDFEPNTWLIVSIYSLHHREDLYPNSKQFDPQRFLNRAYSNYEYIPFGGGNRRCIGSALALLEMKLVTATILSRFKLKLTSDREASRRHRPMLPVRRGLTIAPPSSFEMRVESKID